MEIVVEFNREDVRKAWRALKRGGFLDDCCLVTQVARRTFNEEVSCGYGYLYKNPNHVKVGNFRGTSCGPAHVFDELRNKAKSADELYSMMKSHMSNKKIIFDREVKNDAPAEA